MLQVKCSFWYKNLCIRVTTAVAKKNKTTDLRKQKNVIKVSIMGGDIA